MIFKPQPCNATYSEEITERWTERCSRIGKNDRSISSPRFTKSTHPIGILPDVEKMLRKNQNCFQKNRSTVGQILIVQRTIESVRANNPQAKLRFIDISKTFDFVHGENRRHPSGIWCFS